MFAEWARHGRAKHVRRDIGSGCGAGCNYAGVRFCKTVPRPT